MSVGVEELMVDSPSQAIGYRKKKRKNGFAKGMVTSWKIQAILNRFNTTYF